MSWLLEFLGMAPTPSRNPDDDRWWGGAGTASIAGVNVDAESAQKLSAVWACVGLLSETIASLPLVVYRSLGDGEKERARNHPLYEVLHDRPNEWQTSFEFKEMLTGHCLLRGNGYAEIRPGPRGPVDSLAPIHPDRVTPERLPNGRLRYKVKQDNGEPRMINQEDMFHLRGLTRDGISGVSVIDYARDSFGAALAAERHGGRFWRNDSRPGGILRTEKQLSKPAKTRLKAQWEAAHGGGNSHRVAVLEEGLEWQQVGISPEEAQFLQTREFSAEDVCRWFRVPPHMVGLTSKATSWGSGIEQMGIGFVTYTLMAWLERWTQSVSRDLIIATGSYFAGFIVDALLRGDVESRNSAYATGRQWGWLSANDVRRMENMNPIEDGDVYLRPMNMVDAGWEEAQEPGSRERGAGWQPAVRGHYWGLAMEGAGRLIRKEMAAMERLDQKVDAGTMAWIEGVDAFYEGHVGLVCQTMRISFEMAERYCVEQRRTLHEGGMTAMVDWEWRRVRELAGMAVGLRQAQPAAVSVNGQGNY